MKTRILLMIVMLVGMMGWGGCTTESTTAVASAIGLEATGRILEDLGNITDREKAIVLAQRVELLDELAVARTESQRKELERQLDVNDKQGIALGVANDAVKLADQARETNWAEPEDVTLLGTTLLGTVIAYLYRKKGKQVAESSGRKDKRLDGYKDEITKLRNGGTT